MDGYFVDESMVRRLQRMIDAFERGELGRGYSARPDPSWSPEVSDLRCTGDAAVSGRYPAKVVQYDALTNTKIDLGDCYLIDMNGGAFTAGYYQGCRRWGQYKGLPVFTYSLTPAVIEGDTTFEGDVTFENTTVDVDNTDITIEGDSSLIINLGATFISYAFLQINNYLQVQYILGGTAYVVWSVDQNNYNLPAVTKLIVKVDNPLGVILTGIANGANGRSLRISVHEDSTGPLMLAHEDTGSTDVNRMILPGLDAVIYVPGEGITLDYDTASPDDRWRADDDYYAGLEVRDADDGVPDYPGTFTLDFDSATGLSIIQTAPGVVEVALLTQMSVTADALGVKLVNDEASPGNNMAYQTDGSGVKGWYAAISTAGGTFTGAVTFEDTVIFEDEVTFETTVLFAPSTTAGPTFNIPIGVFPTIAFEGDITLTALGLWIFFDGVWLNLNDHVFLFNLLWEDCAHYASPGNELSLAGFDALGETTYYFIGTHVQAWDADLDAIAALGGTGFAVRTAANTWAQRQVTTADANHITVTNPAGVAGNVILDIGPDVMLTSTAVTVAQLPTAAVSVALGGTITSVPACGMVYKVTTSYLAWTAAATTQTQTLVTIPAGCQVRSVKVRHSTAFAGTGVTLWTITVGTTGNPSLYINAFSISSAPSGTNYVWQPKTGYTNDVNAPSHTATTDLKCTMAANVNLSNGTAGVVDIELDLVPMA